MSIRYEIQLGCAPRNELGEAELAALVWKRLRLRLIEEDLRRRGICVDPETTRFNERTVKPDGATAERTVSLAELRSEVSALGEFSDACGDCPACVCADEFGCFGTIAFPIGALAEEWLFARLASAGPAALDLFGSAATAHQYGAGSRIAEWRRLGLLERSEALKTEETADLTSDALLHELFLVGEVSPNHALGILLQLDAIRTHDGRSGADVLELLVELNRSGDLSEAPQLMFALEPTGNEDRSIYELKRFLYALFTGFALQAAVTVEV